MKAGAKAEQATNAIKTVKALCGEDFELKNFSVCLTNAYKTYVKVIFVVGASYGLTFFSTFANYALAFYFGGKLMKDHDLNSLNEQ